MANKVLRGNKDTRLLVKIIFKIYKQYGDQGTWKLREKKHAFISFTYKQRRFSTTISFTPKNNQTQFQTVRQELRKIGLDKGNNKYWKDMKAMMSRGVNDTYGEMNGYLAALDELINENRFKSGYEKSQNSYQKDINRVHPKQSKPKNKKPYKRIIYLYDDWGREVQYTRYYVWRTIYRKDDTEVNGYISSTKSEFEKAMKRLRMTKAIYRK